MLRKFYALASLLIIGMMVLTACGGGTPAATEAAETEAPVATEAATEAPTEVATEASDPNALPREETLYFNGQQWGPVVCWNPYSSNCNNAMAIAQQDNARVPMFETPYLYNMLDGKQYPLLA
ncbi:MAG TPA: ABC transporter substrate-binding protein, partial [Anaerolineales bacterium]|nr:ABC transporter substrate-binding protein [Anaerolineales bacterium]